MIDEQTQAVLLLSAHFGKTATGQPKPLGPSEYGRLAQWLYEHDLEPRDMLLHDTAEILAGWQDPRIPIERVQYLLGRSAALGFELEKWGRTGLWVLTRASPQYPIRLKRQLRSDAPPVLIGAGNQEVLNAGGLAVVGSRDAIASELALASRLGKCAAGEVINITSGGAGGIDETAMLGALEAGGTAVGVFANQLLRAATSKKYRDALLDGRVALVSPFNPEAAFDVGNAMSRNRYIYCLADAAVVVATGDGTGGTWNGAMQDLKEGWVPLWVNREIGSAGGGVLVEKGARWLPDGEYRISDLLTSSPDSHSVLESVAPVQASNSPQSSGAVPVDTALYDLFVRRVRSLAARGPVTARDLGASLQLENKQVSVWLDRAVADGHLQKATRPVRYVLPESAASQPQLFA